MLKDKTRDIINFIVKHSKIVFPVIVIAAAAITVSVALNAGAAAKIEDESVALEGASTETSSLVTDETETAAPEVEKVSPMVPNEDSAVHTLIATYYNAMALGDTDTLNSVCDEITVQDMLRYQEMAKYIETYPVLEIYTKPGSEEGSTIAFIYYKVVFAGHEEQFPGYKAHYICTNEQGELYIKCSENSEEVNQYIGEIMAQDDVVEFHNRVTVEYNELMESNPALLEYLSEMDAQVKAAVGTELAKVNAEGTSETEQTGENTEGEAQNAGTDENTESAGENAEQASTESPAENIVQYATATTTVNVRSSDSEKADKVGKVDGGTKVQVLEQKVNGWSKVMFENKEGYIKSEYLELIESAKGLEAIGTVTATSNVNVRASASDKAEKLGVLAGGDSAELVSQENGWCKIKYNGQVGYVKADYVQ